MGKNKDIQSDKSRYFIGSFAKIENYESLKKEFEPIFEGRWIKEKNLHMTFKFLGELKDVETVVKKLKKINYPEKQIVIFQRFKVFGKKILNLRSSNKTIYKLHSSIEKCLEKEFIKDENFKPHITLMGIKKIKDKSYKDKLKTLEYEAQLELKVCLIKSIFTPNGVKYKIMREF